FAFASRSGSDWNSDTQHRNTLYASTFCPASLYSSILMSLRKSLSDTSCPRPAPKFQTLLAQRSNSRSWVTPRSSVIASYFERPGDLRDIDGSPPSRCSTTSVERLSADTLLTPAT